MCFWIQRWIHPVGRRGPFMASTSKLKVEMWQEREAWVWQSDLHHVWRWCLTLWSFSMFDDSQRLNLSLLNLSHQNASSLHVVKSQNKMLKKSMKTDELNAGPFSGNPVLQDKERRSKMVCFIYSVIVDDNSLRAFRASLSAHLQKVINSSKIIFH